MPGDVLSGGPYLQNSPRFHEYILYPGGCLLFYAEGIHFPPAILPGPRSLRYQEKTENDKHRKNVFIDSVITFTLSWTIFFERVAGEMINIL